MIPHDLIDILNDELMRVYQGKVEGICAEYWENGNVYYGVPYKPKLFKNPSLKIVDAHAQLQSIRNIDLYPTLTHFIGLIFERPVLAFQSLTFYHGTQQPIHQDTAYVKVNNPMELLASWIALEDIQEGTGELEFYAGSHRLPDYQFARNLGVQGNEDWFPNGQSKWLHQQDAQDHRAYLQWLVEESEKMGLPRQKFNAKKGDVLIWTNDLAHGGSKIEQEESSRLSLVTHYCPVERNPYYFYTGRHSDKIQHNQLGYYSYCCHFQS